ncbi:hypothetical protein JCM11641_001967 [Rhodosporidiobolus odoratus]
MASEAADFTLPSYDQAVGGRPPLEFHVYKSGGACTWSKDDVVTGPDKRTILYHLDFPHTWFGSWNMSLRRGGSAGPEVCTIKKGAMGSSFDISLYAVSPMPNMEILTDSLARYGVQTRCQRTGFFRLKYTFGGANNTEYYIWQPDGMWMRAYDYSLYRESELKLPKEQRKVIAHWRTPSWAVTKDGTLLIHPDHEHEAELILSTALGIEERAREERSRNSGS